MRVQTMTPAEKLAAAAADAPAPKVKQQRKPAPLPPAVAALTDKTPWIKHAPARRYKPDGRPVTTRVHASKQKSHTQVFNPNAPAYRHVDGLDSLLELRFVRDRNATRLYRFVLRNGELTRVQ